VVAVEEVESGRGRSIAVPEVLGVDDLPAARRTAKILVASQASGRPLSPVDARSLGSACSYGLATRKVSDFAAVPGLPKIWIRERFAAVTQSGGAFLVESFQNP